jgi:hypothetical protein
MLCRLFVLLLGKAIIALVPLRSATSVVGKLPCFAVTSDIVGGVPEQAIKHDRGFFVDLLLDDYGGFVPQKDIQLSPDQG